MHVLFLAALVMVSLSARAAAPLPVGAMDALKSTIASDPEAAVRFTEVRKLADEVLSRTPNPAVTIRSEGLLASDPKRVATYESLRDLTNLDAAACAAVVTGDDKYRAKVVEILKAWATTNVSRGNPIDDTKLQPVLIAYGLLREQIEAADRAAIDAWLLAVSKAERENIGTWPGGTKINNWHSHRLMIVGLIGFALDDRPSIDFAVEGFKAHLTKNLRPDGSSLDFHERDALHYHCYDLQPLLLLAVVAKDHGHDLYGYETPDGASLKKSVAFLVPYCDGTKTHEEFVNSKVAFDAKRAASGDKHYQKGTLFSPKAGVAVLELAAAFEPNLVPLVATLKDRPGSKYPTWRTALNGSDAAR